MLFNVNFGYSTITVIVADFVFPELLSVATTVNEYVPTALLAAIVIVVPLILNPDTAGFIAYVYVPVPLLAPVIVTVFAAVL